MFLACLCVMAWFLTRCTGHFAGIRLGRYAAQLFTRVKIGWHSRRMEEDFAFNHSPNTPLWDTLGVYHKVNFENLEKWKYYYFKNGNYIEDYIVQVIRKSNIKVTFVTKYKRATSHWGVGPNAKYEGINGQASEWKEVGYRAEITLKHNELDDQDANAGTRSLYVYDEDVVMHHGGLRRGECFIKNHWKPCKTRKASKKSRTQTRRN